MRFLPQYTIGATFAVTLLINSPIAMAQSWWPSLGTSKNQVRKLDSDEVRDRFQSARTSSRRVKQEQFGESSDEDTTDETERLPAVEKSESPTDNTFYKAGKKSAKKQSVPKSLIESDLWRKDSKQDHGQTKTAKPTARSNGRKGYTFSPPKFSHEFAEDDRQARRISHEFEESEPTRSPTETAILNSRKGRTLSRHTASHEINESGPARKSITSTGPRLTDGYKSGSPYSNASRGARVTITDSDGPFQTASNVYGGVGQFDWGDGGYSGGPSGCGCDSGGCGCGAAPSCCDDACGSGCGGIMFEAEALLVAYHRTDGNRIGQGLGENFTPSYDVVPRVTLGWISAGGTGIRGRGFYYSENQHTTNNIPDEFISVKTFNADVEVFDTIQLNCNWSIELSGGVRYNNFEEVLVDNDFGGNAALGPDVRRHWFGGLGPVIGIEGRRHFGLCGSVYGRFRTAALLGDKFRTTTTTAIGPPNRAVAERFADASTGMIELAIGYEQSCCLSNGAIAFWRVGLETQNWYNFSGAFHSSAFANPEILNSHSDIGLGIGSVSFGFVH